MQQGLRALILFVITIAACYPRLGLCANKVVVIPLEADRPNLSNMVTVAKSGGDHTNIRDAVRSISDASADKPYVVYIAPGVYATTEPIILPAYISLLGSGVNSTIINANFDRQGPSSFQGSSGIAVSFNNQVANLTLNRSSNNNAVGLYTVNTEPQADVRYANLRINVNAPGEARAIVNDVNGFASRLKIDDTIINVEGDNLFSAGIQNLGAGGLRVFNKVDISLTGSISILGITNTEGIRLSLLNSDINITTVATSRIVGIQNQSGSNLDMRNTKIIVGGARFSSVGVLNQGSSSSRIENSRVRSFLTREAQTSYGVENREDTASAHITYSNIEGDTRPIRARNGSGFRETYISFSTLEGDAQTSGSPMCQFNVNEDNIALTDNCRVP